ncbi:phytanoyl-CoA dioxygenase family protein [Pseudomonas phoenicis]|uniref:phytanoyl-CoA dioxygenase family protein n=1 Tax=unclassified Pseudomonas TaxID=196821 RepID=UPI00399F1F81
MCIYDEIQQQGFTTLRQTLPTEELERLDDICKLLLKAGRDVLACRNRGLITSANPRHNEIEPLVISESNNALEVCRIEWLAGSTPYIRDHLIGILQKLISDITRIPFHLFKDKCNFKHPGGGAFGAHQDIAAYRHFDTHYQITAAISLDPATLENGCLEIASGYLYQYENQDVEELLDTPMGIRPLLNYHHGGKINGDIKEETSSKFDWLPITTEPGDIILFDSYVPHRSARNISTAGRRMLYFTFAAGARCEGLYDIYYASKRSNPNNPIFHISTPTLYR